MKTKKKVFSKNGKLFFPSSGEEKKNSSPKKEHSFSPNSSGDLRSGAHQSQIIGRDADVDHTQIIGGDTVKLLGGDISPNPARVSAPLSVRISTLGYIELESVSVVLSELW